MRLVFILTRKSSLRAICHRSLSKQCCSVFCPGNALFAAPPDWQLRHERMPFLCTMSIQLLAISASRCLDRTKSVSVNQSCRQSGCVQLWEHIGHCCYEDTRYRKSFYGLAASPGDSATPLAAILSDDQTTSSPFTRITSGRYNISLYEPDDSSPSQGSYK